MSLFKLMFMSGLVKIQSNCPTWLNLTALEYHYATQPLPTPAAWHALNLVNPFLQRLSVAATFVIEIGAAFLLLAPTKDVRELGCRIQIFLQILIALTGSYTFFNLLTVAMCFGVWEGESDFGLTAPVKGEWGKALKKAQLFVSYCFLAWLSGELFSIGGMEPGIKVNLETSSWFKRAGIDLLWRAPEANKFANEWIPLTCKAAFYYCAITNFMAALVGSWTILFTHKVRKNSNTLAVYAFRLFRSLTFITLCTLTPFIASGLAYPLFTLTDELHQQKFPLTAFPNDITQINLPSIEAAFFKIMYNKKASHGYGLFRSMARSCEERSEELSMRRFATGVGADEQYKAVREDGDKWGWAGKPPSIVARPEIVLEGKFENKGKKEEWRELNFKYKPGKLDNPPAFAAPYQPRLDWQMWFAALGSYQHNPWLVSLIDKLLHNVEDVVNLLDETTESMEGVTEIRAVMYDYDFTRVQNEWNKGIPTSALMSEEIAHDWWARRNRREYIPALARDNESAKAFLEQSGIGESCDEEAHAEKSGGLEYWLYQVHQNNGIWSIIIFAFLGAAFEKLDAMGLLEWLKRRSRRANRWNASASAKEEAEIEAEAEAPPSSNPTSKSTNKSTNKKKKIH
ncbi:hypothetical protein TrLO_g7003 [Triparma laevis f. longispina]|uniref:Lipase maturation factor 2 n=1 Tax=Triparma laevis f. longispina TaxID=1714387 RepID=A0A9W7EC93_9STRA|nr:hypothetical protein TrLO_g7003 [Triparma laevis f. longispina]